MRTMYLFGSALLLITTPLFAQGVKGTAPPGKIFAADDSARLTRQDTLARKAEPQLELPEVLIYGQDVFLRRVGGKAHPSAIRALLSDKLDIRKAAALPKTPGEKMSRARLDESSDEKIRIYAAGGNYKTLDSKIIFRHFHNLLRYGIDGLYERSEGQFDNAQYTKIGARAKLLYPVSTKSDLFVRGGFHRNEYGMYGDTLKVRERGADFYDFGGSLEASLSAASLLSIDYDFSFLDLRTDSLGNRLSALDNRHSFLNVQFNTRFSKIDLNFGASYLNESHEQPDSGATDQNSLTELDLTGGFFIGEGSKLSLGLRLQNLSFASQGTSTLTAPHARLYVSLSPRLGFELEAERGFYYDAYSARWRRNPYLKETMSLQPVETEFAVRFGADYMLNDFLTLDVAFSRGWYEDYWYWQRDTTDYLFDTPRLDKAELTEATIGVRGELFRGLTLDARCVFFMDSFELNGVESFSNNIPYRPEIQVPLSLNYMFDRETKLSLTSTWVGPRVATLETQEKLGSYLQINATISRKLSKVITLYATANNITNQEYDYWQGYQEMQVRFKIGAITAF